MIRLPFIVAGLATGLSVFGQSYIEATYPEYDQYTYLGDRTIHLDETAFPVANLTFDYYQHTVSGAFNRIEASVQGSAGIVKSRSLIDTDFAWTTAASLATIQDDLTIYTKALPMGAPLIVPMGILPFGDVSHGFYHSWGWGMAKVEWGVVVYSSANMLEGFFTGVNAASSEYFIAGSPRTLATSKPRLIGYSYRDGSFLREETYLGESVLGSSLSWFGVVENGKPYTFKMSMYTEARGREMSIEVDAAHSLYWGGISEAFDQYGNSVDFTISSASSADWAKSYFPDNAPFPSPVPEPSTLGLIAAAGLLGLIVTRRLNR